MNEERTHVAMPKLFGGPAYARPPVVPVAPVERPFDPDDLPLESARTNEDEQLAASLQAHPYVGMASTSDAGGPAGGFAFLRGRSFRLRAKAHSGEARDGR